MPKPKEKDLKEANFNLVPPPQPSFHHTSHPIPLPMGNRIASYFASSAPPASLLFIQSPECYDSVIIPMKQPGTDSQMRSAESMCDESLSSATSSPNRWSHKQKECILTFSLASAIHANTYHLLTCDLLICNYLPHQKASMIALLKDRVLNVVHESAPIVLWEMDEASTRKRKSIEAPDTCPITVLSEETPEAKRKILLLKGGSFADFHKEFIETKYLQKMAHEKRRHQKGVDALVLDRQTYDEIERKVLRARMGALQASSARGRYSDGDESSSDESTGDDDDVAEYRSGAMSPLPNKSTEAALSDLIDGKNGVPPPPARVGPPPPGGPGAPPPPPPPPMLNVKKIDPNQVKLKRLHWKNIDPQLVQRSIWKTPLDESITLTQEDTKHIEELFAVEKKSKGDVPCSSAATVEDVCLVGVTRSRNIEVVLRGFARRLQPTTPYYNTQPEDPEAEHQKPDLSEIFPTLVEIVQNLDPCGLLSTEDCEALIRCLPASGDEKALRKYEKLTQAQNGQAPRVTLGDRWLLFTMQHAPFMFERLKLLSHIHSVPELIKDTRRIIETHATAQQQLLTSSTLHHVLLLVREVGRILNRNQRDGTYAGFILECLSKLRQVKSTGRKKYCLLQFIWDLAHEHGIQVECLHEELSAVPQAADISQDMIDHNVQAICSTARFLQSLSKETLQIPRVTQFRDDVMREVEACVQLSGDAKSQYQRCMELFAQKPAEFGNGENLFVWVSTFLSTLRSVQCC